MAPFSGKVQKIMVVGKRCVIIEISVTACEAREAKGVLCRKRQKRWVESSPIRVHKSKGPVLYIEGIGCFRTTIDDVVKIEVLYTEPILKHAVKTGKRPISW